MKTITCIDTGETCNNYQEYLESVHWKRMKNKFRKHNDYDRRCFVCEKTDSKLDVYHRDIKNIGKERMKDMVQLCDGCRKQLIKEQKKKNTSNIWKLVTDMRNHTMNPKLVGKNNPRNKKKKQDDKLWLAENYK